MLRIDRETFGHKFFGNMEVSRLVLPSDEVVVAEMAASEEGTSNEEDPIAHEED